MNLKANAMQTVNIGNNMSTYQANLANTRYVLGKYDTVSVGSGSAIDATALVAGRQFVINGSIKGPQTGLELGTGGPATDIRIGATGFINVDGAGLELFGDGNSIKNAGLITAGSGMNLVGNDNTVFNSGSIVASGNGITYIGGGMHLENTGTISGSYGIFMLSTQFQSSLTRNSGTLAGDSEAFVGSGGKDTFINTGTVIGNVWLDYGNDTFVMKSGQLAGAVFGRDGNDTYVIGKNGLNLVEYNLEGTDIVKSSVSFTLGANFENLTLTGSADRNGVGNEQGNRITGNAGDNKLVGKGGMDRIGGGFGDDILTGGADADTFVFLRHGDHDLITDFDVSGDRIDLSHYQGINSFADVKELLSFSKGNAIIDFGNGDELVLANIGKGELNAGDFVF